MRRRSGPVTYGNRTPTNGTPPTPLLLQSEESRPRRTLGGSIKDCVEILGKQFALLFANPPTGVGLGMLLATLRLRSGKEALKDGFQSGQSIHDAQLNRFQLQAPFRQIAEQTGPQIGSFAISHPQTEKVDSARPISIPVVVMTLVQPRVPIAAQKLVALPFQ